MVDGNSKKISVIIPVYNTGDYLSKCLDSVLNQTYKNFECIIVDDGSQDDSLRICQEYAKKDSRITVIHQENKGQSVARNVALDIITGDYIQFIDSDDWIETEMFSTMLAEAEDTNADIVMCNATNEQVKKITSVDIMLKEVLKDNVSSLLPMCLFNVRVWGNARFSPGRFAEDAMLFHKIINKSKRIVLLENNFYNYYFENPNNSSNSSEYKYKNAMDRAIMFIERYRWVQENNINDVNVKSVIIQKATSFSIGALGSYKQSDNYNESDIVTVKKFFIKYFSVIMLNKYVTIPRKIAVVLIILSADLYYNIKNVFKF